MSYQCVVCEKAFSDIPEDAVEIAGGRGRSRRPMTYAFADGSVHYLRKLPQKKPKQQPQTPAPEPKEDTDLLQATLSVLAELPTPPTPPTSPIPGLELKSEPLPPIEPEFEEDKPTNVMQFAFKNLRRSK